MATVTDVHYELTLTAATSANVTAPKAGVMQLYLHLDLATPNATGLPRIDMAMSLPQFYTLLSTLEEARIALNAAEP